MQRIPVYYGHHIVTFNLYIVLVHYKTIWYLSDTHSRLFSMPYFGVLYRQMVGIWFVCMVFNATFKNISVILWQSVLLVEEENHRPVVRH